MKNFLKNNYKLYIISLFISIFLGYFVSKLLFPDYQFAIYSNEGTDYLSIGTVDDVKIEVNENDGEYNLKLSDDYIGKKLNISYQKKNDQVKELIANNKTIKTYKVNTYGIDRYDNITFFNMPRQTNTFLYSFIVMTIVLCILFVCVFHNGKYKSLKTNIVSVIGKKHIIISSLIILVTMFLICGSDAKVIVNCARWFTDGIDIYQFQINSRNLLATEYAEFPYNPISMLFYGGFFKCIAIFIKNIPLIKGYPYFQIFTLKFLNLILIQTTILQVLNYLYHHKKIASSKIKLVYYLSIFNPVTFYVAFLYVQLDPLSLFLITTGLLTLEKIKDKNYIGVFLISFGLVIKTQLLVFFPILLLSIIIYSFQKERFKNGVKKCLGAGIVMTIIVGIFYLSYTLTGSAFHLLNAKLVQAQRIYFTILNYMGPCSIFLSIFFVGLAVFSYAFSIKLNIKKHNLVKVNLLYLMILIFTLSATIVPTPSIYVLSLPAFMILLYDEDDILRIILTTVLSVGIIMLPMLSAYGDITILLSGFDKESLLLKFTSRMTGDGYLKFSNLLLTVSSASMVAYNIYALKKAKKYMEVSDEKI